MRRWSIGRAYTVWLHPEYPCRLQLPIQNILILNLSPFPAPVTSALFPPKLKMTSLPKVQIEHGSRLHHVLKIIIFLVTELFLQQYTFQHKGAPLHSSGTRLGWASTQSIHDAPEAMQVIGGQRWRSAYNAAPSGVDLKCGTSHTNSVHVFLLPI